MQRMMTNSYEQFIALIAYLLLTVAVTISRGEQQKERKNYWHAQFNGIH